ncbi:hypothetical protein B9G69_006740 [Bdellovibrio sp. SKB1291214]|uniref:hypothetical protein n=1 Tax=Bdellovibrio sp. SKB1291214 TaxID=1732569 RepID=UPI000B51E283|nr:hypothetical protein [Bdellovibrio sp. SKB1291214]UYL10274.1 hypothetical protein B9G69_006740 [Bdellovibrio sp. SKB1291214]
MKYRSFVYALILALVTNFVSVSEAQQQVVKPSQNETARLIQAAKYMPKILDNKKISFKQGDLPPGKFEVSKQFGPGSGGGGNTCAMSIVKLTKDLVYQGHWRASLSRDQELALQTAIQNATFVQGESLPLLRGEKKNAINFPDYKLIVVDKTACDLITAGGEQGYSILIHEYMGLAGIDDRDYSTSMNFVGTFAEEVTGRDGDRLIFDRTVKNVYICAATCQSESLGIGGHDVSRIGSIFFIPAKEVFKGMNSAQCMEKAKEFFVTSNRMADDAVDLCAAAMTGKFQSKFVDITASSPEAGFAIVPAKKGK